MIGSTTNSSHDIESEVFLHNGRQHEFRVHFVVWLIILISWAFHAVGALFNFDVSASLLQIAVRRFSVFPALKTAPRTAASSPPMLRGNSFTATTLACQPRFRRFGRTLEATPRPESQSMYLFVDNSFAREMIPI